MSSVYSKGARQRALLKREHASSFDNRVYTFAVQPDGESRVLDVLSRRIRELGDKATQLLTFLSFAIVAAILLQPSLAGPCQKVAMKWAVRLWVIAIFPILINVLPVKEIGWECSRWYERVRNGKVVFLWLAVAFIAGGAIAFLCAVW